VPVGQGLLAELWGRRSLGRDTEKPFPRNCDGDYRQYVQLDLDTITALLPCCVFH
jgi:hypothetical protein